ncbi:Exonuclease 1 [Sesamum alatum]|uniref:Exonuclease 1 n=1 Tax=Sesamum alatum TaxID=300844 RepID=A0AAE1Z1J3_9LAMI|nr:Exonuclease 1 [Sesamum alatum]
MGIQGLLPLLKSIMNPIHIKELEGCFVAVDTYSWLHKGALSCSTELCKGQPTSKHIDYCMHRVNMLRHYGVKPILVFDGGPLPMKSDQEIKRARSRRENLSRAEEHESNGNLSAAYECYQKAVDISPSVAYGLIQVLKQENVSYIVAPYEADAQMTFLALSKQVEGVITEDSDLIAFGCPRIIYKMDKFGQGVEFKNAMLQYNKELNLAGFTQMMLLEMCILSGCDYLPSLPGMGLKKAHALMKKFKSHENVMKHLKYNSVEVTPLYEESFKKAIWTFKHQRVYDPVSEDIVHLSEPADITIEDSDFLDALTKITSLPQHIAKGIAQGDLDPFTKVPIQMESGSIEEVLHGTYQHKNFKPDGERKRLDLPAQKNLLTNYFCFASLEAKRKFKAPRITPKHPNESNKTSSPCIDAQKVMHGKKTDGLEFMEAKDHGPWDDRGVAGYNEMKPFTIVQNSVCKPCVSLHKDLDSDRKSGKAMSVHENGIVRSRYFLKRSRDEIGKENSYDVDKNGDNKLNNVVSSHGHEPLSAMNEKTCRKDEKIVTLQSSCFRQNIRESANCEIENALEEYPVQMHRLDFDAVDRTTTIDRRKDRARSSYCEEISVSENNENPELGELVNRGGFATQQHQSCNYSSRGSLSSNNPLEGTLKKRKTDQNDSPTEDASDNNRTSGTCTSDLDEDMEVEERKFGCNISHLGRYSDIAEKSMEKFVSVISSFRYNSSGSRASGLRAPLKDIKNNCTKSSTPDADLRKFAHAGTGGTQNELSGIFQSPIHASTSDTLERMLGGRLHR